ncbi:o-succinylbenzoate--CoA ligase [Brevibacillus laterosporus]|uniref:o-succinylbenzoate--CoA ligase n=1 Tax=Brevibacillus laterosporus TaxID=1465 RepID=UPI0018F87886|nr:o-succinylbenzoate--CoA ligase [Brevibacillus laterosporus]MBG9774871.1 acyl-CoA synthetase [Brevibacillus laterosporus]
MHGIAYWIDQRAQNTPNRIAIITEEQQLTFKEMGQKVNQFARFLQQECQVAAGDRVGILSQNSTSYVLLLFAIAKLGGIAVPLNIRLTASELSYQIEDSGTTVLFTQHEFQSVVKQLGMDGHLKQIIWMDQKEQFLSEETLELATTVIESNFENAIKKIATEPFVHEKIDANAPYLICYTSGTTGRPKGAVLTQENMFWNAIHNLTSLDITSSDRSIILLPLFHIGGIGLFAFPTLFAGGSIVILGRFHPDKTLEMIQQYQVTIVMGVPAIHDALRRSTLFSTTDLSCVRWFYNGGAPCPHELILYYQDRGLPFGQGFGLTETSPTVCMLSAEDASHKVGSIGKPVLFCEVRLVDEYDQEVANGEVGELVIKGPHVMKEYWNLPNETAKAIRNGWFYTGDLARKDEDGFFYIAGRRKEMIISGGENIYPLEVEQAIGSLPEVVEVAVVGVADEKWGEVAKAFVVVKEGATLTEEMLQQACLQIIAKYKMPKYFVFLSELPRNATGKINKTALQKIETIHG